MIEFKCRQCGESMEAPQGLAGETERCPKCGSLNRVRTLVPPNQDGNAILAEVLAERDRFGKLACLSCGKESPVVQFGSPTLHCLHCGFTPAAGYGEAWFQAVGTVTADFANALAANDPTAKAACASCGKEFPIRQYGRNRVICPHCGFTPTRQDCRARLHAMVASRAKAAHAAMRAAAAATAARFAAALVAHDPGGKLICTSCGSEFAIVASGEPDLACPHCGFTVPTRYCEAWLAAKANGDSAAARLAAVTLAEKADATELCISCGREFPVRQYGMPILACPRCGWTQSEQQCEAALMARADRLAEQEKDARERELAEAAKGIATETQPDRGQGTGGYVYALLNSTMPGLVKIGKTEREPEERARELSAATGIPTPFVVAYAEWFKDCSAAEDCVHALLEQRGFRVAQNREFFCAPVKAVIQAIMKAKEREERSGDLALKTGELG